MKEPKYAIKLSKDEMMLYMSKKLEAHLPPEERYGVIRDGETYYVFAEDVESVLNTAAIEDPGGTGFEEQRSHIILGWCPPLPDSDQPS